MDINFKVNPITVFQKPKFGDFDSKAALANQWSSWKKGVKNAVQVYQRLQTRLKTVKGLEAEEKKLLSDISGNPDAVASTIQQHFALGASVTKQSIIEGVDRFRESWRTPDRATINEKGYRPWEEDLLK